ncbi:MAG: MOSC domain-containing protein [Parvularculaceae bacterium]
MLGEEVELVHMDERALREKASVWTPSPVPVSFADAFPILVTTTGSLAALNEDIEKHGGDPVPMARFRPNIVIDCDEPWAEDHWSQLKIGDVILDLVKPSDRCIVTTTDQKTGERMGKEPLASLARIHRSTDPRINGVIFGENAAPRTLGEISVGDNVSAVD